MIVNSVDKEVTKYKTISITLEGEEIEKFRKFLTSDRFDKDLEEIHDFRYYGTSTHKYEIERFLKSDIVFADMLHTSIFGESYLKTIHNIDVEKLREQLKKYK